MKRSIAIFVATVIGCAEASSPPKGGAGNTSGGPDPGEGGGFSQGGNTGSGGGFPIPDPCAATMDCTDFPADPIFEGGAPANAPELFGPLDPSAFNGPPPCVMEPHLSSATTPGAMFPANWLAPRVRFSATGDLFEVRFSSEVQANDLIVYTTNPQWIMPKAIWLAAAENNAGLPMTVTVRALAQSDPSVVGGVQGDVVIAPVFAGGSMVFWTVNDSVVTPQSSKLYGYAVGDEAVTEVLSPGTVQFGSVLHESGQQLRPPKPGFSPGQVQCVGCHTSTPDGLAVVFTDDWPWNKAIASVTEEAAGSMPEYLTPGARALLKMPWLGTQTMSPAFFTPGSRLLVASYGARSEAFSSSSGQNDRLLWINLETTASIDDTVPAGDPGPAAQARNAAIAAAQGTGWGLLDMNGEARAAVTPEWSQDGSFIVYVSTDNTPNGHPGYDAQVADLYSVPFNGKSGGSVAPIPGASDPDVYEYWPSLSPDDALVAFNRAPQRNASNCPAPSCPDGPYYNRFAEINVIPVDGGTPTRLVANDPVGCAGDVPADGLINSWPKWSPKALSIGGKTYYFVIFSSARSYPGSFDIPKSPFTPPTLDTRSSQLYMAAVVRDDATGALTSYPGLYLWNQNRVAVGDTVVDSQSSNLTPAWDDFSIPEVPNVPQ